MYAYETVAMLDEDWKKVSAVTYELSVRLETDARALLLGEKVVRQMRLKN